MSHEPTRQASPSSSPPGALDVLDHGPYEDGFSSRTVVGALFVALVMMPGSIYMSLVAGQSLGAAAEWVTIILFAELARRSFAKLKRQEVFVLFYVASGIAAVSGGPFAGAIWNQYLLQAPETSTLASQIPDWVVPPVTSPAIQNRNLAHPDWWYSASRGFLAPATLVALGWILGRMGFFGLGYIVFRLTSDMERLPFPLAPIAAEGATALAESTERESDGGRRRRSWRWNVFSVGASLGIVFACLYVLLPVASGLFLSKPIMLFPIPFVDFTANVEHLLPGSLISLSFDAGLFLAGMVLPFKMVAGTFTATVLTGVIGGPILLRLGAFPHWTPGNGLLVNQMILSFDFWLSVSVGFAITVLLIGLWSMGKTFLTQARHRHGAAPGSAAAPTAPAAPGEPPFRRACRERGDYPVWVAVVLFCFSVTSFSWLCKVLVPDFPFWIVLVFGFVWSPLHSYVSARLIGVTGTGLATPYLRETVFILSRYRGTDIWFAPVPNQDYGGAAARFRELELTRTRFTSLVKAELLMFPIIFVCSFLFWAFFWHLNQIPSSTFPFVARVWPVAARQAYLIFTANSSESPLLLQALNPRIIVSAAVLGLALYRVIGWAGLPAAFFYGLLGGMGAPLHGGLSLFVGALLGRYYFRRRIGEERWSRYVPVVAAGFACGAGLAGMLAVSLSLIMQCAKDLPF